MPDTGTPNDQCASSILISPIHSLEAFRNEIIGAIDFLITGV
jgi:hypothetical protein